ncbi:MAG TPA: hypothetical protein VFA39_03790 [Steroidobacteraceae bacterium]|nr:hypothetical protein [Steroidobacteraceae bacterium]
MLRHTLNCLKAVPCAFLFYLAGCGGYGGGSGMSGYGGNPPMMMSMPTVMFSSPTQAPTIHLGQAVSLAWTSSNATSCSASPSSDIGGAFSGSEPASGSVTVAPVGTGTVTYTLACTGAGGTGSATTVAITVLPSILSMLSPNTITAIGSTVDPVERGGNPYGLAIAPATAGLVSAGDLIVCNFNDGATNTEGKGTTIVGLHPTPGSTPYHIAQSPSLQGCNALAILPDGNISAAAFTANQNPLVAPAGTVSTPFSTDTFASPWGEAFAPANGQNPAALYVSNANGTIDRITLNGDTQTAFTQIVQGFCGSGQPGAIYAPSGLTYDGSIDTLYVIDTSSFSVIALANVSSIGANGVMVAGQCGSPATAAPTPTPTFSGPSASSARVIAHGTPLFAPLSAALLTDGDLVVTNSDINITGGQMPNLAVEVSPVLPGGFVGQPVQLDTSGTPGALFGIAATADSQGNDIIYFNDDNTNTVMKMTQ